MINFRYHLISIVAVFLALGIGLLVGSSIVDNALLDSLKSNNKTLSKQKDDLQKAKADVERDLARVRDAEKEFADQGSSVLLDGRLKSVPVLIVAMRGTTTQAIDELQDSLVDAGARSQGVIWFTSRLALADPSDIAALQKVISVATVEPKSLRGALAGRFGEQLAAASQVVAAPTTTSKPTTTTTPLPKTDEPGATASAGVASTVAASTTVAANVPLSATAPAPASIPSSSTTPAATTTTLPRVELTSFQALLNELRDAGFVDVDAPRSGADPVNTRAIPLGGTRVVVVSGDGARVSNDDFVYPLLRQLGAGSAPVLAAEVAATPQAPNRGAFVVPIRDDAALRKEVTTVDNLDEFAGRVATVLALADMGDGRSGFHYGHAKGRDRLLPSLTRKS
ncbi:MAG: copper transporter [Acidimicrobiia bacterium]